MAKKALICRFFTIKVVEEIVYFLFDLDGNIMIQSNMVLGLNHSAGKLNS